MFGRGASLKSSQITKMTLWSGAAALGGAAAYTSYNHASCAGGLEPKNDRDVDQMFDLMGLLFKPHPWHGLGLGPKAPETVTAYVECVPGEPIKYEVDKGSGYIMVDRPHKFSSLCPTIYGFLPQTYCGDRVAERCMQRTGLKNVKGDGDPIDVCVLSTRVISRGDLICRVRPIGGLRMIDDGEADDKIIAIIEGDPIMSSWKDISDIPPAQLDVIRHYFLTYKQGPDSKNKKVAIPEVYDRKEAYEMIERSSDDYQEDFASLRHQFAKSILGGIKKELALSLLNVN